ncbi:hypothetical protein RJ639_013429, partial [Escallonia herrerae]
MWKETLYMRSLDWVYLRCIANGEIQEVMKEVHAVLLTKVKKFELKGLREHKVIPESTAALEELLQDVYFNSCPKQSDYRHRRDLVQVFNEIAKELYGKSKDCPIVEVFGSFAMDIFSSTSDLDLSVNFNSDAAKFPKEKKIRALWKFAKKLNALQSFTVVKNLCTARLGKIATVEKLRDWEIEIGKGRKQPTRANIVLKSVQDIFLILYCPSLGAEEDLGRLAFVGWSMVQDLVKRSIDHHRISASIQDHCHIERPWLIGCQSCSGFSIRGNGHVYGVQPIMSARVPIVKVVDSGTRIECDISVENRDGILKSHIVGMISSIDARFQKLSFLMKAWAKVHNINSSKDQTLNSLSIILLVAFHLQTLQNNKAVSDLAFMPWSRTGEECGVGAGVGGVVVLEVETRDPPILPPFSVIFEDGTDPSKVKKLVNKFSNYGENNKESLAELFVTLLIKVIGDCYAYTLLLAGSKLISVMGLMTLVVLVIDLQLSSVEKLWPKGLCASTYQGSWISKTWNSTVGYISVEDFTDRSQNVARAVGRAQVEIICKCIQLTVQNVFAFIDGRIQWPTLREFLFGR